MVDEVAGMQHFEQSSLETAANASEQGAITPYLRGYFPCEPVWWVFSPFALAQSPGFLDVAL